MHPSTPFSELVILATTQTHSLAAKAALILGLDFHAIETKQENDWALRGEDLEKELASLEAKGKKPFVLSAFDSDRSLLVAKLHIAESLCLAVATLGSTSTGAVDRIAEITAVSTYRRRPPGLYEG